MVLFVSFSNCTKKGDDEDEDVYTSTDPKKREPTPCEGNTLFFDECLDKHCCSYLLMIN